MIINTARLCALAIVALCAVGCSQDKHSRSIASQYVESNGAYVNLATAVPDAWERVCVLGPYSDNQAARRTLGFEWNAEAKTSILSNEGISLLLFVQGNEVIVHVEHSRISGDFSNLTGQCFPREKASFTHVKKPGKGWLGLFPKDGA